MTKAAKASRTRSERKSSRRSKAAPQAAVGRAQKSIGKPASSQKSRSRVAGGAEGATALYLYCIAEKNGTYKVSVAGVDGTHTVNAVHCGAFWCWVSSVSRREFADRLDDNMQNLEWLAEASVRHQQVVAEVAAHSDVLPARFATVFLSEDSLRKDVQRRRAQLRQNLERVRGCDEWGVKIYAIAQPAPQAVETDASGRGYLERKSQMLAATMRGRGKPDPATDSFAAEMERISRDVVASAAVSRGQPGVVWQRSFLIPRRNREKLMTLLEKYAQRWRDVRRIECTGPWPPYSFVSAG
jgi:hypothetical protein